MKKYWKEGRKNDKKSEEIKKNGSQEEKNMTGRQMTW